MSHLTAWRPAMLAGLALIPALATTPALAQTASGDVEVHKLAIGYGDLDLSTAWGRAQMDARLRHAAARVCGEEDGIRPSIMEQESLRCYNAALHDAHNALALALAKAQQAQVLVRR